MSNKKSKQKNSSLLSVLFLSMFVSGFSTSLNADVLSPNVASDIQEPSGTYDASAPDLLNMNIKTVISAGPCIPDDYVGCTLNDVLNDIVRDDGFSPEIKVHMTADNYPDDGLVSNAELRQRGKASRLAPQKSFRVKLDKNIPTPLWRGERRLQLNKSPWERTRILQKLSYDLFKDVPHIPSMRTQFVRLSIEDQGVTEDYGLYTQIEYFGKEYLERRGWDDDSRVYKPKYFWFQNDPAFALDADGKPLDEVEFEKIIEIKRGKKHQEFFDMIQAVNDRSNNFQTAAFDKFFNIDNYLTWFAINILTNNTDTTAKNFYLYNPKSTDNFYFLPWDYDYAWGENYKDFNHLPRWWFSHANWWTVKFHKRFLQTPGNYDLLKSAVTEVRNKYLTTNKINALKESYYDIVFPVIRNSPDWDYMNLGGGSSPERVAEYNRIFNDLSNNVEFNYARFLERANDPMGFYLEDPEFRANHDIRFKWGESESLSGQTIVYDLEVSTTKEFTSGTVIENIQNIDANRHTLHWTYPKGTYYFRITARDANNPQQHWQIAFDSSLSYDNGDEIFGVMEFYVSEDGDTTNPPPPPPSGSISNPVNSITVNGNSSDWNGLILFANDPDDVASGSGNVIDWRNAGMAHNDGNLYVLYNNHGSVDSDGGSGSYIPWGWQAFLDTDNNASTGFQVSDALGVDYLIEGNQVIKYTGTGNNWSWQSIGSATSRYNNSVEELSIPRSLIGNPQSLRVLFQGANEAFGGNTLDVYPDGAFDSQSSSRYFSYSFGNITPPDNQAPVASNQNESVVVNTRKSITLNASDADGDALSLTITQQPAHGTLAGSSLFVQYTPDQNYSGSDMFSYRVNDGTVNSNVATVSINVVDDNPGNAISNPVVNSGITINGSRSDWNSLTLFASDPNDVGSGATNRINWLQAGIAHSNDTVYLMYQNRGQINPEKVTGSALEWGWQTYLDTDGNANTGYQLNSSTGADYLVEGNNVFRYAGNGTNWNWVNLGGATVRYNNTVAELSFPRSLLGSHSAIKVAFLGNNEAHGGSSIDNYPDGGNFEYFFGAGSLGSTVSVASTQRGLLNSPQGHQPSSSSVAGPNTGSETEQGASGGGSISWLLLFLPLFFTRRYLKTLRSNKN